MRTYSTRFPLQLMTLNILAVGVAKAADEAGGAHHEPSISDLLYPAVNFTILVVFLLLKLKKPTTEFFNKKSEEIRSLMSSAEEKSKDANLKLKSLQVKVATLDAEVAKIKSDYVRDAEVFKAEQLKETRSVISRMEKDYDSKLEAERSEFLEGIQTELLNEVITKARGVISESSDMKKRATTKIISGLN